MGVFPSACSRARFLPCLPHARGGVSTLALCAKAYPVSSPRTWGCFRMTRGGAAGYVVFPTHVGVFPTGYDFPALDCSLPHARGGFSGHHAGEDARRWSSPRTWGCFLDHVREDKDARVFPTHVGVFLRSPSSPPAPVGLPHARGGVSWSGTAPLDRTRSSPRTWGCFHISFTSHTRGSVFPTHVGVFPCDS